MTKWMCPVSSCFHVQHSALNKSDVGVWGCGCGSSALQIHPASVEQKAGRRCSCRAFCLCLLFSIFRPPGLPPLCRHRCLLLVSFTSSSLSSPRVSGSVRTCLCLPPSCVCLTIYLFLYLQRTMCVLYTLQSLN